MTKLHSISRVVFESSLCKSKEVTTLDMTLKPSSHLTPFPFFSFFPFCLFSSFSAIFILVIPRLFPPPHSWFLSASVSPSHPVFILPSLRGLRWGLTEGKSWLTETRLGTSSLPPPPSFTSFLLTLSSSFSPPLAPSLSSSFALLPLSWCRITVRYSHASRSRSSRSDADMWHGQLDVALSSDTIVQKIIFDFFFCFIELFQSVTCRLDIIDRRIKVPKWHFFVP